MGDLTKESGDESLANLSALTASMSLDAISDISDTDEHQTDNELTGSDDELRLTDTPPISRDRIDINSERPRVSPPPSPIKEHPTDPVLLSFRRLAGETLASELLTARPKFSVYIPKHAHKHAFSRTWVPKKSLSSIVEKPERLKATCLGIGLAQSVAPFKLQTCSKRSSLYSPHFEAVHGKDWATELYALCSKAASKLANGDLEVPDSWPYFDIYLAPQTVEALEGNLGCIEDGVDDIFTGPIKRAFLALRPPGHHCHEDEASGFCIINNAHIAIQYAKQQHGITHAVILDFDLHHGDGSQDLLWKLGFNTNEDASLPMGYFSIHDINSFPCETNFAEPDKIASASVCFVAHNCGIWNVHLKPYQTQAKFDEIYNTEYSVLFKKAAELLDGWKNEATRTRKPFKPLIVLSAGFDGSEFESPGMQRHGVSVPTSFFNRFSRDVVALAEHYGQSYLLSLLEGGYSPAAVSTGVFSHLTGLAELEYDHKQWCLPDSTPHEIDWGMRQRWRMHPEKWTALGIQLGRTLFPIFETAQKPPPSAQSDSIVTEKHTTRRRPYTRGS